MWIGHSLGINLKLQLACGVIRYMASHRGLGKNESMMFKKSLTLISKCFTHLFFRATFLLESYISLLSNYHHHNMCQRYNMNHHLSLNQHQRQISSCNSFFLNQKRNLARACWFIYCWPIIICCHTWEANTFREVLFFLPMIIDVLLIWYFLVTSCSRSMKFFIGGLFAHCYKLELHYQLLYVILIRNHVQQKNTDVGQCTKNFL